MSKKIFFFVFILLFCAPCALFAENPPKSGSKAQPMTINGDVVEYSADAQEATATGNVEITTGDTKLTCEKLTVNTQTKDGIASGHVRLEDKKGVIEGEQLIYNFQTKTGTITDGQFRANPFFGRARKVEKESEKEIVAHYGYVTTCSLDRPHFRIASKRINIIPKELVQTRDDCLYIGAFPVMSIARFNQMFDKPVMHVSVLPGKSKDWGPYLLSTWEYNLRDNIQGRGYLDYRDKLGWASGFGVNYTKTPVGNGDLKFYYSKESSKEYPVPADKDLRSHFRRYLLRLRHKWDISSQTNFVAELYKIYDEKRKFFDPQSNILKDYFYREYEKDVQPLTYALFHHSFGYSSIDLLLQDRINHWYDQLNKMPEIKYTLPSLQLGSTPLYFENSTILDTFNKKITPPIPNDDTTVTRLDTINKVSIPMKVAFFQVSPFVQSRQTIYDKGANDANLPIRTIFYSGVQISTKFYRLFDMKNDFLGLDLNGLRHIITPTVNYSYNHSPTIPASNLQQIDSVDSIAASNSATLELSNKLQTKRQGVSIDLVDFLVTTSYTFHPQYVSGNKTGSSFQDVLFKAKLLPYSWMRLEADATYKHSGPNDDQNFNKFTLANYDLSITPSPKYSFGLGQRYERKGQNQFTGSFEWRISPKWRFKIYQRYNMKDYLDSGTLVTPSTLEQQYTIIRDLHCWEVEFTFGNKRNNGSTVFLLFRLKAFPENEFGYDQNYARPKSGSQ